MIKWQPPVKDYPTPWWIKVFSFLFLVFLVFPLIDLAMIIEKPKVHWVVQAFGFQVNENGNLALALFLDCLLFLGGLSALGILLKKRWGLMIGRIYSLTAIAVCGFSQALSQASSHLPELQNKNGDTSFDEMIALCVFLWWLCNTIDRTKPSHNHDSLVSQLR